MGSFGDKFRKAREKKELSLDDVSSVTKISSRMLQAIEEEQFDQLPGGVFNRGFIRAYAKHLGLNSEDAVNDYLACLRQAQIDSHAGWDAVRPDTRRPVGTKSAAVAPPKPAVKVKEVEAPKVQAPVQVEELPDLQLPRAEHVRSAKKEYLSSPPLRTPWTLIAAAALVVLAVAFLWIRHSRTPRTASANASDAAPTQQAATAPSSTPLPATGAAPAKPASQPSSPAADSQPAPSKPVPAKAAEHSTAHAPTNSPPTPASDSTPVKVEHKGDVTIRSFGSAATKPAEPAPAKLTLVVRATENSWISVTADGQLLTQETLIAPAATSFHATRELVVRVGNAAAVSFLWNGQEFPSQGAASEAKTFVFDAQGMHSQP